MEHLKQITGISGKYIGRKTIKLEDGSKLTILEDVALQVIDNATHYGSIMYDRYTGKWSSATISLYEKKNPKNIYGSFLENIYTFSEAAQKWGLSDGAVLRKALKSGRFNDGEVRQSGNVWLVTREAMERLYNERKL